MVLVLAEIEWSKIVQVLWAAPLAGIGITILFSIGLLGSTRAAEASRAGNGGTATAYGVLAALAFVAFAAGVVFGVSVILNK